MALKIFIGWSGDSSRMVAKKLSSWLPEVVPGIETWMSDDIKGGRVEWFEKELNAALRRSDFAIMCISPENWHNPWMSYEPGVVLGKTKKETRIWPYVIDPKARRGLMPEPLKLFWAEKADYDGTLKLVRGVDKAARRKQRSRKARKSRSDKGESSRLTEIFEKKWPDLNKVLKKVGRTKASTSSVTPEGPGLSEYIDDFMTVSRCIQQHQHRLFGQFCELIVRTVRSVVDGSYDRESAVRSAIDEIHRSKANFDEPSLLVGNVADFFAAHYTEDDLRGVIAAMELTLKPFIEAGRPPTHEEADAVRVAWLAHMKQAVLEVFLAYHEKLVDELRKVSRPRAGGGKKGGAQKRRRPRTAKRSPRPKPDGDSAA